MNVFKRVAIILIIIWTQKVFAKEKLDVFAGYFSLDAKTSESSGKINNLGAYQLNFRYAFSNSTEISIGYSLMASKTFSGDFGFGPDLGLVYFPFSSAHLIEASNENMSYRSYEHYKPYLISSFHQRQYQSIQSSYAGFSLGGGVELYWKSNISFNTQIRYLPLGGPNKATSNELDFLFGLTFNL